MQWLSVHIVSEVIPSVADSALQTAVCDGQLVSVGGEVALSGNTPSHQRRRSRHSVYASAPKFKGILNYIKCHRRGRCEIVKYRFFKGGAPV